MLFLQDTGRDGCPSAIRLLGPKMEYFSAQKSNLFHPSELLINLVFFFRLEPLPVFSEPFFSPGAPIKLRNGPSEIKHAG